MKGSDAPDPVTGLPQRPALLAVVASALERQRSRTTVAVAWFRIGALRTVNDAFGFPAGDALLTAAGEHLVRALPSAIGVARVGSKHFAAAFVVAGSDDPVLTRDVGDAVAGLAGAWRHDGLDVRWDAACGVAVAATGDVPAPRILQEAERAMRGGGQRGRFPTVVVTRDGRPPGEDPRERLQILGWLDGAAERGELQLVYQPIFSLRTAEPVGVEAFVRWNHPDRGAILPERFIPLAIESGAIVGIGRWVVDELLQHATDWTHRGLDLQLHYNAVSPELLDPTYAARVLGACARHGIPPSRLTLEVLETGVALDGPRILPTLRWLRDAGVRVAIDDFASPNKHRVLLGQIPADMLKFDRQIIARLPDSPAAAAAVRLGVEVAGRLGMDAVAKGIENRAQALFVAEAGVKYGQGFALAGPQGMVGELRRMASRSRSPVLP